MIFNSVAFALFLPIVLALHWTVPAERRNAVLLVSSYVFYGWWDWRFLFLIAGSTVVDFTLARRIHQSSSSNRLRLLWVSIVVNLGVLGVFKYSNFFIDSFEEAAAGVGWSVAGPTLDILLPVGISFYTFQTISYSFDVYRKRLEPTERFIDFATYVAYFPQLVAGPIERAQRLLPRIEAQARRVRPQGDVLASALGLILLGLFKKVVIADGVAPVVNDVFADPDAQSWVALIVGVVAFGLQIYGDFSGYTDIARGVSELFGITLVVNFREPYLSRNITEFWRRWHISLSDWLRDYLYIPLGGNRGSQLATMRNLMITMLLGGLWHGASINFVIWGALHGLYLAAHRWLLGGSVDTSSHVLVRDVRRILGTFGLVSVAWVFFRADSLADAVSVFAGVASLQAGALDWSDVALVAVLGSITVAIDLAQRRRALTPRSPSSGDLDRSNSTSVQRTGSAMTAAAMVLAVVIFSGATPQPFIYFQF